VRGFAALLARAVAAERGWSEAELGDRSIPTAGFGPDGLLHLSYGEREFLGRLTPELTIALTDADGRPRKTLPTARKSEDGELVAQTRRRLTFARKEVAAVLKVQGRRLYEAMCVGRSWQVPQWRELFADHPLARHLAARLVWMARRQGEGVGAHDPEAGGHEPRTWTFRPTEDGELLGADDAVLELPPDAVVTLAHGTLLPEAEVTDWQEHLADYEITPLFDQFSAGAPQVESGQWGIDDGAGQRVVVRDLRKRAKARGYEPDSTIYWYTTFLKDFPAAGLCSVIDFSGADVWSEDQVVTTGPLSLVAGRRAMPLEQVRASVVVSGATAQLFTGTLREALDVRSGPHPQQAGLEDLLRAETERTTGADVDQQVRPQEREAPGDERLIEAIGIADAGDVLTSLSEGLAGMITEKGRSLSGGQRQRVALARALLTEAPTLVLIEPTSALDSHTEARVAAQVHRARAGRTTVVVTASPLVLEACDEVILLDSSGAELLRSTHRELMAMARDGHAQAADYRAVVSRAMGEDAEASC